MHSDQMRWCFVLVAIFCKCILLVWVSIKHREIFQCAPRSYTLGINRSSTNAYFQPCRYIDQYTNSIFAALASRWWQRWHNNIRWLHSTREPTQVFYNTTRCTTRDVYQKCTTQEPSGCALYYLVWKQLYNRVAQALPIYEWCSITSSTDHCDEFSCLLIEWFQVSIEMATQKVLLCKEKRRPWVSHSKMLRTCLQGGWLGKGSF